MTSQGSNQECYRLVIGPENQYTGQRIGHSSKLWPNVWELIMSLKEQNNVKNFIVKFTRLLQETQFQLLSQRDAVSAKLHFYQCESQTYWLTNRLWNGKCKIHHLIAEASAQAYGWAALIVACSHLTHLVCVIQQAIGFIASKRRSKMSKLT